jgi:hypothetical protein
VVGLSFRDGFEILLMKKSLAIAILLGGSSAAFADFTEGFESGPTGFLGGAVINFGNTAGGDSMVFGSGTWHAKNESTALGSTGWFSTNTVFDPRTGNGQLNANFNNTAGAGTINNFMMSPVLTFNNGDVISFWTRTVSAPQFADRLLLKLSVNGASTVSSDFSSTLVSVNPGLTGTGYPATWTQFSTTLSGLGGPTSGRFAFNYNVTNGGTGANSDFIGIDDVSYVAAVPEPATMLAMGLGVAGMLRRRKKA